MAVCFDKQKTSRFSPKKEKEKTAEKEAVPEKGALREAVPG